MSKTSKKELKRREREIHQMMRDNPKLFMRAQMYLFGSKFIFNGKTYQNTGALGCVRTDEESGKIIDKRYWIPYEVS